MSSLTLIQIKCDVCNKTLLENELEMSKSTFGFGGNKTISKNAYALKFDAQVKKADCCFSCAKKIRDFIEALKEGKK